MYVNSPYGISLAHNGNLTNAKDLAVEIRQDLRHLNTSSDSEILLNVFANAMQKNAVPNVMPNHVFQAVEGVHERCKGAYAVVA